jgi:hypothetical protein
MSLTADTLEQRVIVGLELILGHINRSIKHKKPTLGFLRVQAKYNPSNSDK